MKRCVYCGRELDGRKRYGRRSRGLACIRHFPLLNVDPHYAPELKSGAVREWVRPETVKGSEK